MAPDLCELCDKRPAAFQVKARTTSRHWRCLGCFRSLTGPVVVTGVKTHGGEKVVDTDLVLESMAVDLMAQTRGPEFVPLLMKYRALLASQSHNATHARQQELGEAAVALLATILPE